MNKYLVRIKTQDRDELLRRTRTLDVLPATFRQDSESEFSLEALVTDQQLEQLADLTIEVRYKLGKRKPSEPPISKTNRFTDELNELLSSRGKGEES